jgi:hypothetical protein
MENKNNNNNADQTRLIIQICIIATAVAVYALDIPDEYKFVKIYLAIPTVFSLLYVITLGLNLRYDMADTPWKKTFSKKSIHRFLYNFSMDFFIVILIISVIASIFTKVIPIPAKYSFIIIPLIFVFFRDFEEWIERFKHLINTRIRKKSSDK